VRAGKCATQLSFGVRPEKKRNESSGGDMDVTKIEEIEQYLHEAVPTQNIRIEEPDITNIDFKFKHEITGNSHTVRISTEYIDDHKSGEFKKLLHDLRLSEHIEKSPKERVNVTNKGIVIGDI
jgi:hypothetical protein